MSPPQDERMKRAEERLEKAAKLDLTPAGIAQQLGQWVVGQDNAVQIVAVALHSHIHARVRRVWSEMPFVSPVRVPPILLMGPTGCGKTQLLTAAARLTGLPFYHADSSQLTATGYQGDDVSSWVRNLMATADFQPRLAEVGMLMVDEIDKKAARSPGSERTVHEATGAYAQDGLLRLLEGGVVAVDMVDTSSGVGHRYQVPMDCRHLLVLLGGAFCGIEEIIRRRLGAKRRMGFGGEPDVAPVPDQELRNHVSPADLIEYGMKPELIGRLGQIVVMPALSRDALRHILVDVPDGPIQTAQSIAATKGYRYEFSSQLIDAIVDEGMQSDLGARAMVGIVARATTRASYEVPARMRDEGVLHGGAVVMLRRDSLETGWYGLRNTDAIAKQKRILRAARTDDRGGDVAAAAEAG